MTSVPFFFFLIQCTNLQNLRHTPDELFSSCSSSCTSRCGVEIGNPVNELKIPNEIQGRKRNEEEPVRNHETSILHTVKLPTVVSLTANERVHLNRRKARQSPQWHSAGIRCKTKKQTKTKPTHKTAEHNTLLPLNSMRQHDWLARCLQHNCNVWCNIVVTLRKHYAKSGNDSVPSESNDFSCERAPTPMTTGAVCVCVCVCVHRLLIISAPPYRRVKECWSTTAVLWNHPG